MTLKRMRGGEMLDSECRRKLLRTLFLFLTGFLIVTASASVYNLMYMQASPIPAETAKVQFVTADDGDAAGASIGTNGTYVSLNSLAGWPNATRIYEAAVGIKNFDNVARTIELKFDSWSGSTTNIDYIFVKVFSDSSQQGSAITVGAAGSSTGSLSIPSGATWRVEWEIRWKAGALSTDSVSVVLQLIVTGE
jgi:hypothetical protein